MAIKQARYLFMVSDQSYSELEKGAEVGKLITLENVHRRFIVAEHSSEYGEYSPPLHNGRFFFGIRGNASIERAKELSDYLNRNLETIGTETLDSEDVATEVAN